MREYEANFVTSTLPEMSITTIVYKKLFSCRTLDLKAFSPTNDDYFRHNTRERVEDF